MSETTFGRATAPCDTEQPRRSMSVSSIISSLPASLPKSRWASRHSAHSKEAVATLETITTFQDEGLLRGSTLRTLLHGRGQIFENSAGSAQTYALSESVHSLDYFVSHNDEFNSFYQPKMDRSVSNVGVRCQGALNMGAFQCFLNKYLGDEALASDFLRTKAVLNIAGMNERFVVQCVHMVRNQDFKTAWGAETRENRIIFIGRGMQQRREELTQGFLACIQKPLRFSVGTKVKAKTGPGPLDWEIGHIIEHWDGFRPYRMRLLSGEECQAPMDDDAYIMRA
eukprot:TRINITY_DN22954_c0_g1_i1.p1 TRINITY_DN22954_c0_g1~~TRINITY_DN22954_c0_g1_i1.p1  ORF type:complete len:283 (+),score=40.64 TRINITY_DN22954_c0_g1_i1:93-941(+)